MTIMTQRWDDSMAFQLWPCRGFRLSGPRQSHRPGTIAQLRFRSRLKYSVKCLWISLGTWFDTINLIPINNHGHPI